MAGNVSIASAVVADTTDAKGRAGGMGLIGMSIGLGFILGPAIGGVTSLAEIGGADGWRPGLALNPFSVPAVAAAVLALVNLAWVTTRFPETLPPERRGRREGGRTWNPLRDLGRLGFPGVGPTTVVNLLAMTVFSAMEFTLTFLAVERLAYRPLDNMWMFLFVGVLIALVQGGFVRRLAPRLGERRVAVAGFVLLIPGFVAIAVARSSPVLYLGLALMAIGQALIMPCLSSLISRYVPADRQGAALGHFRSAGSLGRAVGPLLGGLLYWRLGSAAPYWIGAAALLLPAELTRRLPAPGGPDEDGGAAAGAPTGSSGPP